MRVPFIRTLADLAERDPRIVLLTGDLGFTVLEPFGERFPDRLYNVGVAEQNMIGLATGLAEAGMLPFAYSIATFASMRPYEFIRNGPVLHELPVRIVGIGGGFDYGHNGATHYALEDIGIMRVQPGLTVVVPADDGQARRALVETYDHPGPIYYRISKGGDAIPGLDASFELGRLVCLRQGKDVALIALGPTIRDALVVAARLATEGIEASVALVSSFNPAPEEQLADLLVGVPLVVTVESHYVSGGLGSLVSEVIAEHGVSTRLRRCGITDMPRGLTGSQEFLDDRYGLSVRGIERTVKSEMGFAR